MLSSLAFTLISCKKEKALDTKISYQEYQDYTIVNSYKINDVNFKIINNIDSFNTIFKIKDYANNQTKLSESDFKLKKGIAVIYQFNNICNVILKIDTVIFSDNIVKLYYDLNVSNGNNGITCNEFAQPNLFILTNKTDFSSVEFYKNNILIKVLNN